jgi:predicted flap endonuclease-1-like 5' DNA nuclease
MIVEGQVHGGLTEGFAIAFMQEIPYDSEGNNLATNFTDYLVPTALESPRWETGHTVTPSPHHPIGAKGVGESPNVGSPAAFVNAVMDALKPLGVTHIDMPLTREKVWSAIQAAQANDDLTRIEGIGPKMSEALKAAGIKSFARLASSSEADLRAAIEKAGLPFAPSLGTWAEQAGYLVRGDEAGFKKLTDELQGGRRE